MFNLHYGRHKTMILEPNTIYELSRRIRSLRMGNDVLVPVEVRDYIFLFYEPFPLIDNPLVILRYPSAKAK